MEIRSWEIVVLLSLALIITSCNNPSQGGDQKRNISVDFRNGDIAFRCGEGVASRVVLSANSSGTYSHVGVIAEVEGVWSIIHIVPFEGKSIEQDKIYCDEVGEFFSQQKSCAGAIYRYNSLDTTEQTQIYNYLLKQLRDDILFDHDYDLTDDKYQYCSELVWRSYLEIGVDLSEGRRSYMPIIRQGEGYMFPVDIESNNNLELIYSF